MSTSSDLESSSLISEEEKMAAQQALKAAKKELRKAMKGKLSKISEDSIQSQSTSIFNQVIQLPKYKAARRIGIYLSMPSAEVQTDAIVKHALQNGKTVFVPYLYKHPNPPPDTPKSVMDMVDLKSLSDYTSLERDSWGIPTIKSDKVDSRERILGDHHQERASGSQSGLDMILVPGVAFDKDSDSGEIRRLGHGKGFYDYFLHRYLENEAGRDHVAATPNGMVLYGLALREQYLESGDELKVPVGPLDHRLNGLFIGTGDTIHGPART